MDLERDVRTPNVWQHKEQRFKEGELVVSRAEERELVRGLKRDWERYGAETLSDTSIPQPRKTREEASNRNAWCYTVLELSAGATQNQIRSAYRRLSRRYHPDLNADPAAALKLSAVQKAWKRLHRRY